MRQIVQTELKCNEKMGVEGVRNRGHGDMWIVLDCKCFHKRWDTLFEQICKGMGNTENG